MSVSDFTLRAVAGVFLIGAAATVPAAGEQIEASAAMMPRGSTPQIELLKECLGGEATMTALLIVLMIWLAEAFDLPPASELPCLAMVPSDKMAAARYHAIFRTGAATGMSTDKAPLTAELNREIVAFYDEQTRTIHLSQGWRSDSPADLSILIHELVHHLQEMAGLPYPCPQAREELAFAAQKAWLARFGKSLEREFGIDGMTILLRTRCLF